jgi:hypothetical protein
VQLLGTHTDGESEKGFWCNHGSIIGLSVALLATTSLLVLKSLKKI